jgi:elongation factor Ts
MELDKNTVVRLCEMTGAPFEDCEQALREMNGDLAKAKAILQQQGKVKEQKGAAEIDAKVVMRLREQTGAPMMDCKQALREASGDLEKAKDNLRKKGKAMALKAASREVKEGLIFSYVHHNGKVAVLAEIVCETDFVAKNEAFQAFGKGVCLAAAAYRPLFLNREAIDPAWLQKEREIVTEQTLAAMKGKPQQVVDKAIEGRMDKIFAEKCLVEMPFVNPQDQNDTRTIEQVRTELVGKIGENIQVRRFVRMELGG